MSDKPQDDPLLPPEQVWELLAPELQSKLSCLLIKVAYDTVIDSQTLSDAVEDKLSAAGNHAKEPSQVDMTPQRKSKGKLEREGEI
jgi:hypothetical protein